MEKLKQSLVKMKTWFVDHYHLLFRSAADNHLRIQKCADGSYQCLIRFNSYTELKNYQKKFRRVTVSLSSALAMVAVAFIVAPYIMNPNKSSAASFLWNQTSWNSTPSPAASIAKPGPGTTYQSLDAGVQINNAAPADSSVALSLTSGTKTQTNTGNQENGFNGTGVDLDGGKVAIKPQADSGAGNDGNVELGAITSLDAGTGADGNVIVSATKNLNTDFIAAGRNCADGISYNVVSLTANTATLSGTPPNGCFSATDKVMLINEQGSVTSTSNAGNYELLTIQSVSGSTITFTTNKTKYYGEGASDDTNIGIKTTTTGDAWTTPYASSGFYPLVSTGGDLIYSFTNTTTFKSYSIASNSVSTLQSPPAAISSSGFSMAYPRTGDYIYAFQGGSTAFWTYSISTNTWSTNLAATAPLAVASGGRLMYPGSGDLIYAFQGGSTAFWAYSISTNTWSTKATTPLATSAGASLIYPGNGDYIYALKGGVTTTFWAYSISHNNWTTFDPADAPVTFGTSASLAYPGSGDFIYAYNGGTFKAYSISNNNWTTFLPTYGSGSVSYATNMVYPGSGDYMYINIGSAVTGLLRYEIRRTPTQKVVLQRIPQYDNLTINSGGTLTASGWDGTKGGVLAAYVKGNLVVNSGGKIDVSGKGYRGGTSANPQSCTGTSFAQQGESYNMQGSQSAAANLGGGGGVADTSCSDIFGNGGGYGTAGNGTGAGATYGSSDLAKIFLGSGGGGGIVTGVLGAGGRGGGIAYIVGNDITLASNVLANGANSSDTVGGAGSGGSIYVNGTTLNVGTGNVQAVGGTLKTQGGDGRIKLKSSSIAGTSSPTAFTQTNDGTYYPSGIYTSSVIDTGQKNPTWGNLAWNQTLDGGTIGILIATSADNSTWTNFKGSDGTDQTDCVAGKCYTTNTGQQINAAHNGHRYIKFKAFLTGPNGDVTKTPKLNDITLNFNYYPTAWKKFISSPFDTGNINNSVQKISWNASNDNGGAGQGAVNFQIRTSADNSHWEQWCGPDPDGNGALTGCATNPGESNSFYTQKDGSTSINSAQTGTTGNKWIQYAAFLKSVDGIASPILSDVTMQYAYNMPPVISGVDAQQQPNGSVNMSYTLTETLDDLGHISHGNPAKGNIYERLFYQPDGGVKLAGTLNVGYTGAITFTNSSNPQAPIPSQGMMLIGDELLSFDSGTATSLNITGRGKYLDDPATTYKTNDTQHSANDAIYFLATKNTGGGVLQQTISTLSDVSPATTQALYPLQWDPRNEQYLNLDGKKISAAMNFRIMAHDADLTGVNNISSVTNATVSNKTLDLEKPTLNKVYVSVDDSTNNQIASTTKYKEGSTIYLKAEFSPSSDTLVKTGTVTLNLSNGSTCSGSNVTINGNILKCTYTVGIDQNHGFDTTDLNVTSISGTITDSYGNAAILTMPTGTNSLEGMKDGSNNDVNVVIDTIAPTFAVQYYSDSALNNSLGDNPKLKAGTYYLKISSNESLNAAPTISINAEGNANDVNNSSATQVSGNTYKYTRVIANDAAAVGTIKENISVSGNDNVGNSALAVSPTNGATAAGYTDTVKPVLTSVHIQSNNSDITKAKVGDVITLSLTANETLTGDPVATIAGQSATITNISGSSYSATYTMQNTNTEGNIPFTINFTDAAGNVGDQVNSVTDSSQVVFDKTAPTISEITKVVTPTNNVTPSFTFTTNEAGTIAYSGGCASSTANAANGSNTISFNTLIDGAYGDCKIVVTDATGNSSSQLAVSSFTIDTHGMDITISSPANAAHVNASYSIDFNLAEDMQSGAIALMPTDGSAAVTKNLASANLTQGAHSDSVAGLVDGKTYTLTITGKDLAGNDMHQGQVSDIVYDTTAPTPTLNIPAFFNNYTDASDISYDVVNNINGVDESLASATLTFTPTGGNSAPLQDCNLTKNPSDLTVGAHSALNLANSCQDAVTLVDGATYSVKLHAVDKANNAQDTTVANIAFDTSVPVLTNFTTTSDQRFLTDPEPNGPYGKDSQINITANFDEPLESGSTMTVILENSANPAIEVPLTNVSGSSLSGSFTVDGPRKGYDTDNQTIRSIKNISAIDRADNVQADINAIPSDKTLGKNIAIDTGSPMLQNFTAVKKDTTNSTGYFKAGDQLTISAFYSKPIQTASQLTIHLNTNNGNEGSQDVLLTKNSSTTPSSKLVGTYTVMSDDNVENLKVASIVSQSVIDLRNNELATTSNTSLTDYDNANAALDPPIRRINPYQGSPDYNIGDGIQIDTQVPINGSIAINQGQSTESLTKDNTVKLTLNADEAHPAQMQFSNNGSNWCAPVAYATSYDNWDLLNTGCGGQNPTEAQTTETVYARFIDQAGNVSDSVNDNIIYDNTKPVVTSITADQQSGIYGPTTRIILTATYSEPVKAGSSLTLTLDNNIPVDLVASQDGTTMTGTYTVGSTGSAEDSSKLKVKDTLVNQYVMDLAGNSQNSTTRTGDNIDKDKTLVIDTTAPTDSNITIDRASEEGTVNVKLAPSDTNADQMSADVQMLSDKDAACNFSEATSQKNIAIDSNPRMVTFEDTNDSIKKACIKYKDFAGNVSGVLTVSTPEIPKNFAYTDISNVNVTPQFLGAFLTWQDPLYLGTSSALKVIKVLDCKSADGSDCTPNADGSGNTTVNTIDYTRTPQNYFVYNGREANTKYCYRVYFENTGQDKSAYSKTFCAIGGQGSAISNTQVEVSNNGKVTISNIAKTSASVSFQTYDSGHDNAPLPTKANVEVYADPSLTTKVKEVADADEFKVAHSVEMTGLEPSTTYYLKITVTDFTGNQKEIHYTAQNSDLMFTTIGQLSKILNISNPPAILSDTKAEITFDTDQDANCYIEYGTKSAVDSTTQAIDDKAYDPTWALETKGEYIKKHAIHLTSLFSQTSYYYRIGCTDNSVNVTTVYSFSTQSIKDRTAQEGKFQTLEKQMGEGDFAGRLDGTAPTISSVATPTITGENATITWNTDEVANSLVVYEAENSTFSMMAGDSIVNADRKNFATSHSVTIAGLIPATKYLFTVMSYDASGNIGQSTQTSLQTKEPSSLSSIKVVSTALGQATITWETSSPTTSLVEYGATAAYGQTKQDSSKTKDHTIVLEDLTPGQVYHFRVKGEDDLKNIFASTDATFQPKAPPKISDFKVDSITEHGATVAFTTNVPTDSLVTYTDSSDPENSGFQGRPEVATKHEIQLKDLASGVDFSIKVKVIDEDGNATEENFASFSTTKDEAPPKIDRVKTDSALTQTDKVQSIISWTTDEMATGTIVYREGKTGEEKTFEVSNAASFSHVGVITSFKPGTVYYFNVKSIDSAGNAAKSTDYALLTPKKRQNIIQIIIGNFTDIFGWAKF